uniref:Uncharacterized protein n=1 Tax=Anguilla anguilla TaxID=7936 RepID=A0A0E9TVU6_ANGAN
MHPNVLKETKYYSVTVGHFFTAIHNLKLLFLNSRRFHLLHDLKILLANRTSYS